MGGPSPTAPTLGRAQPPSAKPRVPGAKLQPGPRLRKQIPWPRSREVGWLVLGSPQLRSDEKPAATQVPRGRETASLTCKQGFPSGRARSDRPPGTLTCTPIRLQPIHLPAPGPTSLGCELVAAAAPASAASGLG